MKARYFVLVASRIAAAILQTVGLLLLARWSDPASFGRIAAFLGAMMFASAATNLGLANYVSRARAQDALSPNVPAALRLNRYTSVILGVLGVPIGLALGLTWPVSLLISFSTAIDKNSDTTTSVLVADRVIGVPSAVQLVRRFIALLGLTLLYWASAPLSVEVMFAVGLFAGSAIANVIAHAAVYRVVDWTFVAPLKTVFVEARHFWFALIGNQLKELQPTVLVLAAGPYAGGLVSVALRFTRPMVLLAGSAAQLLLPSITRRGIVSGWPSARAIAVAGAAATVALLATLPFIPWVIDVVIGDGYEAAVLPTQILLASSPVIASTVPLGAVLQGQGLIRQSARISTTFGVLGLALSFIVAASSTVTAAVIAIVLVSLTQACVQLAVARRAQ